MKLLAPCLAGVWVAVGLTPIPGRASTNQAVFTLLQGDDITWHAEQGRGGKGRYPHEGEIFKEHDRLVTGRDGKSELCMTRETVIRVGPNSLFYLQPQKRWLSLKEGSFLLQKMPDAGDWTVETGGWVAAVSGSSLFASFPPEGPMVLGVLETSSPQGIRVRTRQGTGNWSLSNARMLWSEAPGEPAEILPFDPGLVWKYSLLGSNLPGTTWPECAGKIPELSPPRASLEWNYQSKMYEGYPATLGKRSDALLRVDRYLLPAAYGTEEEALALIRNQPGFSTLTDPDGHHPLSVALDVNRLDLVKVFLPAFKLDAFLNRGREKFPGSFLAKSPLPRAVLMLPPDRFRDFLSFGSFTRREILDTYAVGANFALLGGKKPAGGYYYDVAANLVTLAAQQKALAKEENEALLESCLLPALLALPGAGQLVGNLPFSRSREAMRISMNEDSTGANAPRTRSAQGFESGSFSLSPTFFLSDNFAAYGEARLARREISPVVKGSFVTSPKGSAPSISWERVLEMFYTNFGGSGFQLTLAHVLQWSEWWHGPGNSPRPYTRPEASPVFSQSPDRWPMGLGDRARALAEKTALDFPGTPFWIAGGRWVAPAGDLGLLAENMPDSKGGFCAAVREPYPSDFYLAGHYPVILEYGKPPAGLFGWLGDVRPVPVPAKEQAKIHGRVLIPESGAKHDTLFASLNLKSIIADRTGRVGSAPKKLADVPVGADGYFEISGLAPLLYELVVRLPGWCVHREFVFPGRSQSVEVKTISLEKAPVLSVRHLVRIRRPGQAWTTSPSVEHESVICDNENSLTFSKLPVDFSRELQYRLRLDLQTQDQRVSAVSMYNQTLAEVGNLQVRGAESFEKIPPGLMTQIKTNIASTGSISFRKGRTYLQKGEMEGIQWEWLIEVD